MFLPPSRCPCVTGTNPASSSPQPCSSASPTAVPSPGGLHETAAPYTLGGSKEEITQSLEMANLKAT